MVCLVIAAVRWIEDERFRSSSELIFCPKGFDELGGCHVAARADKEARISAELCVDRGFEAFVTVRVARFNHHFEDFVAVVFDVIYFHMLKGV